MLAAAQGSWDRFLLAAGKRCGMKVQAALRSVREIDVAGQMVILRFAHAFHRDLVNQGENRLQVESLWSEMLNRRMAVRCALVGENTQAAGQTPAASSASGKSESDEDAFLREARSLGAVVKRLDK